MNKEKKIKILREILGNEHSVRNNEYIFYCKNKEGCNGRHHKPKLYVNVELNYFHCWVCNWSSKSLIPIFRMGARENLNNYIDDLYNNKKTNDKKFDTVKLPEEFVSLSNKKLSFHGNKAKEYLYSRGLTDNEIIKYKLGYCEDGEYKLRVIIPSFDSMGYLNFFVGRNFYDDGYLNYKHGIFSKDIIFNEYMVDWTKPITLTEGPFDSIIGGENVVPLQGSELNEESKLFVKLVSNNSKVYIALDSDAVKKQISIVEKFIEFGLEVCSFDIRKYKYKDIGSMPLGLYKTIMEDSVVVRNKTDLIKLRLGS